MSVTPSNLQIGKQPPIDIAPNFLVLKNHSITQKVKSSARRFLSSHWAFLPSPLTAQSSELRYSHSGKSETRIGNCLHKLLELFSTGRTVLTAIHTDPTKPLIVVVVDGAVIVHTKSLFSFLVVLGKMTSGRHDTSTSVIIQSSGAENARRPLDQTALTDRDRGQCSI